MFFWIEFGLAVLAIGLAYAVPNLGSRWFERAEQLFSRFAQRRALAVITVGLAALAARAALLPILPIPQAGVIDEFGYLLQADTFAHGRLTNPTHPLWIHFETFSTIWRPTYTAMYYPAQGMIMALGRVIAGHPFWGIWLSLGIMCAAICWMLQGWLPPGWALLGGFLAVIRLGTFSYWANSYFGGALAATGGALVLGALPRIKRSQRVRDAVLMGIGFALIGNTRPYEGVFLGLPVAGAMMVWLIGTKGPSLRSAAKRVLAPILLVFALTLCGMGYYFWRTTGKAWDTPYLVYLRTYHFGGANWGGRAYPWQPLEPAPVFHHAVFENTYRAVMRYYERQRTVTGTLADCSTLLVKLWDFYLGPVLTLPILLALATLPYGFSWRNISSSTRYLLLVCGGVITGSMLAGYFLPHYVAPIAPALLALVLQAMRHLRSQSGRAGAAGLLITRAVPTICLLMLALRIGAKPLHIPEPPRWLETGQPFWYALTPSNLERAATLAELRRRPGLQLAIVRYGPHHEDNNREWVYNEADIDRAKVVWARDMGPAKNKELVDYFRDRQVWLVEADETPPRVVPYSSSP
jgi:hypothetical protein